MTKQEKIRDWLENELDIHIAFKYSKQETTNDILSYLHSNQLGNRLKNNPSELGGNND